MGRMGWIMLNDSDGVNLHIIFFTVVSFHYVVTESKNNLWDCVCDDV